MNLQCTWRTIRRDTDGGTPRREQNLWLGWIPMIRKFYHSVRYTSRHPCADGSLYWWWYFRPRLTWLSKFSHTSKFCHRQFFLLTIFKAQLLVTLPISIFDHFVILTSPCQSIVWEVSQGQKVTRVVVYFGVGCPFALQRRVTFWFSRTITSVLVSELIKSGATRFFVCVWKSGFRQTGREMSE